MDNQIFYKRTALLQNIHDHTVITMAKQLEGKGFRVLADHPDWISTPFIFGKYAPDIIAIKEYEHSLAPPRKMVSERYLFEIETVDSYTSSRAFDQLAVFNEKAVEGLTVYWVIVCRQLTWISFERAKALSLLKHYSMHYVQLAHFDSSNDNFEVFSR